MEKSEKVGQALTWIAGLFVGGIVLSAIGLTKGQDIASFFSRPGGAAVWTISDGLVLGATYIPVMVGASMMVLAMVFATILFLDWLKSPGKDAALSGPENTEAPE